MTVIHAENRFALKSATDAILVTELFSDAELLGVISDCRESFDPARRDTIDALLRELYKVPE